MSVSFIKPRVIEQREPMKNRAFNYSLFILLIINVETRTLKDFTSEQVKPWYTVINHRFYGPWNILYKRNGDYVDYNDYGSHTEDHQHSSVDLTYDGQAERYLNEAPASYSNRLSIMDSDYGLSPIGLAVFRTGIRTGNINDEEEIDDTTLEEMDYTTPLTNKEQSVL